jgi:hypothetical protein
MPTAKTQSLRRVHIQLSFDELPDTWRALLKWGPCLCQALKPGEKCLSCLNVDEIEATGLIWEDEYNRALEAGETIIM